MLLKYLLSPCCVNLLYTHTHDYYDYLSSFLDTSIKRHSLEPLYHSHISRIQNRWKVLWNCHHACPLTPPPPTSVLLSKLSVIRLYCSCPALFLVPLLRPHQLVKTSSRPCSSYSPSSRSTFLSSFHHPVLIYGFWPISRVTPCTSLFLRLKPLDIEESTACFTPSTLLLQNHMASHMAGVGKLPDGQNSNVNSHVPSTRHAESSIF